MEELKRAKGREDLPLISGPLAEALERGRKLYNARFVLARRMNRRLDPEDFSRHLAAGMDPIVRAVARVDPSRIDRVVEALFDISLELVARECLGPASRYPLIDEAWRDLLTLVPHLMIQDPSRLAASVSNGVYNLCDEYPANARGWLDLMMACGPDCSTVKQFLELGQVAAWRFGLAHFRPGALRIWAGLTENLQAAVLGLPLDSDLLDQVRNDLMTDPWKSPDNLGRKGGTRRLALTARVGGFRGFGGSFINPPEVIASGGLLFAFDSECCWSIHADCFGATLKRYGRDIPLGAGNGDGEFIVKKDGLVQNGKLAARFPALADFTGYASTGLTLAVTVPRSHRVFLVAAKDFFDQGLP